MFEKIVLRRSEGGAAITAGELAEALFFYQNVHIVLDYGSLSGLNSTVGLKTILKLLRRPNVSAVFCEDGLGTKSETKAGRRTHSFVSFMFVGSDKTGDLPTRKKRLQVIFERYGYKKREAKKLTERFHKTIPIKKLNSNYYLEGGIIGAAFDDLEDENFVFQAITRVLIKMFPSTVLPADFYFKVELNRPSFIINTNLDFAKLTAINRAKDPKAGEINEALLINNILSARGDLTLAAHYGGEYYTSEICSEIIRLRQRELLRRIGLEKTEKELFQEIVLDNGRALREVINNGERSFDEFLILLDKSEKFKEWIRGVNPDEKLVRDYMDEMGAQGWVSKVPSKTLRYVIGSAIGMINPVIGLAISAGDTFFLEKLFGGWKPSHFVDNKLKPFIDTQDG